VKDDRLYINFRSFWRAADAQFYVHSLRVE
jgi:hypothetical protein